MPKMAHAQNLTDPGRLHRLAEAKAPDRERWGSPVSYPAGWAQRSEMAARLVRDGARVLEIGAGTGAFRDFVSGRCRYTGADLAPLDPAFIALDLDRDPLPEGPWDVVVLLGVLEYLHNLPEALDKLAGATPALVMSYCCRTCPREDAAAIYLARGWVNALSEEEVIQAMSQRGFSLRSRIRFEAFTGPDFAQAIFEFADRGRSPPAS